LPTLLLIVGYPIYWLELYIFRVGQGQTTFSAWIIFGVCAFIVFLQNYPFVVAGARNFLAWFSSETLSVKLLLVAMGIASGVILLCAFYASLLPPHLSQEFDALNYHITLPRQHLLLRSFSHISWSTADLYFLPIDFALAPFWLATSLPNKIPQFFFVLGLFGVCGRLAWRFSSGKFWPTILVILAVIGSHNIGIQAGTAMLDITICYLFLAAFDSFLNRSICLGAIEFGFYFWSKPLIPVQFFVTFVIFILVWLLLRTFGIRKSVWATSDDIIKKSKGNIRSAIVKGATIFLFVSSVIAGPFIFKSLRYSGTPIFPIGVGVFRTLSIPQSPETWEEIKLKAAQLLAYKDVYGSGRSLFEFLKHFWFIAVPEKGVNNRYDYPLGLMYLLFLGPFLLSFFSSLRQKILPLLSLCVIVSWGIWWMGCQQTRFLFVPLILMYLAVAVSVRLPSRVFLGTMLIAIFLVSTSVYRAHRQDFGQWGYSTLRQKDKDLIQLGKGEKLPKIVALPFCDVAYATFPVKVANAEDTQALFVLKTVVIDEK